ncbi:MAG: hypothetical protein ACR2H3_11030 [Acidimicrobiales bacterium]
MTARMNAAAPLPSRPSEADRPELRVVGPGERSPEAARRQARVLAIVVVVIAAALLFSLVATQVAITQRQFQLQRLEGEADGLQASYDRLRLQVAELESPARIVAAGQQLGLEQPSEVTYLTPTSGLLRTAGRSAHQPTPTQATSTSWQTVKPHLADN